MRDIAKNIAYNSEIAPGIKFSEQAMMLAFRGSVSHGTYRPPVSPNSLGFHRFNRGKQIDVDEFDVNDYQR